MPDKILSFNKYNTFFLGPTHNFTPFPIIWYNSSGKHSENNKNTNESDGKSLNSKSKPKLILFYLSSCHIPMMKEYSCWYIKDNEDNIEENMFKCNYISPS